MSDIKGGPTQRLLLNRRASLSFGSPVPSPRPLRLGHAGGFRHNRPDEPTGRSAQPGAASFLRAAFGSDLAVAVSTLDDQQLGASLCGCREEYSLRFIASSPSALSRNGASTEADRLSCRTRPEPLHRPRMAAPGTRRTLAQLRNRGRERTFTADPLQTEVGPL